MNNRLANEKSPYLLQHAHNPVDWHPWSDEAFEKARRENKPIFLSIGYSTCHWCHVMAHESFEDEETAALLNENFVSVKVDREERPDVDQLAMTVCQALTGGGGWPLSVFLTPEKKPFFAGTYFPKSPRHGLPAFTDILRRIAHLWENQREKLVSAGDEITRALLEMGASPTESHRLGIDLLAKGAQDLSCAYDRIWGGFGTAPKFPAPHQILFLLRWFLRTGDTEVGEMVQKTLKAMRCGGIYDQIGFGFHRYSVDEQWIVPHFEKMLYDQAALMMAYTEAYQVFGSPLFKRTALETAEYVLRDLTDPSGAFYCAEDADSDGKEGTFYLWTPSEIRKAMKDDDAAFIIRRFGVTEAGNFEGGKSVLHIPHNECNSYNINNEDMDRLNRLGRLLFETRARRIRPHRDEKILAGWNGLMIAALAKAYRVFGDPGLKRAAIRAEQAVREGLWREGGRLFRRLAGGEAGLEGCLDDYAFMIWGLMELTESLGDAAYARRAVSLTETVLSDFRDVNGGLFLSSTHVNDLIARPRDTHDGAIPSATSVMVMNLLRLSRMTGRAELEEAATKIMDSLSENLRETPTGYTHLLSAIDFAIGPTVEAVIVGNGKDPAFSDLLAPLRENFLPRLTLLVKDTAQSMEDLDALAPFTREMTAVGGRPAVYLCEGSICKPPITDAAELARILSNQHHR
ncbi:MAG: thioredoxin domain-containing protein [Deltaproteobacteria bacterium]